MGDRGSGKTLITTALAVDDDMDRPVYANYKINIPNWHRLEPQMLPELSNCLVCIDEAYLWLDCRAHGKLQEFLSYILFQSRKDDIHLILTQQIFGTIDIRFREMADLIILAECKGDPHKTNKDGTPNKNYTPNGKFKYSVMKRSNIKPQFRKIDLPFIAAEKIYPYYDTNEKIPISPDLISAAVMDKTTLLPEVEVMVNELLRMYDPKKISKPVVADFCVRRNVGKVYIDLVFNAIKAKVIER